MKSKVALNRKTRNLLKQIGTDGQTYDNIIAELLATKGTPTGGGTDTIKNSSDTDNDICDGIGCHFRPDYTVQAKVGKGTMSLSLCHSCKTKFDAHSDVRED